jgi:hypothetical protein
MSHWHADSGSGPAATPKKLAQAADAAAGVIAPGVWALAGVANPNVKPAAPPSSTNFRNGRFILV